MFDFQKSQGAPYENKFSTYNHCETVFLLRFYVGVLKLEHFISFIKIALVLFQWNCMQFKKLKTYIPALNSEKSVKEEYIGNQSKAGEKKIYWMFNPVLLATLRPIFKQKFYMTIETINLLKLTNFKLKLSKTVHKECNLRVL